MQGKAETSTQSCLRCRSCLPRMASLQICSEFRGSVWRDPLRGLLVLAPLLLPLSSGCGGLWMPLTREGRAPK